jgi:hypothetical protein
MLEKLVIHDVQDVSELFSLADKCAKAVEGCVSVPYRPGTPT